jgi:hypothetical protein
MCFHILTAVSYNSSYCLPGHDTVHSGRNSLTVICGLLGNYTASCGNYLPTFRDNVSVPSSWVKIPRWKESLCTVTLSFIPGRSLLGSLHSRHISPISHPAAVQHIVTLHPNPPPPSHPIGHCHIARLPTPPCCQVSLSQAFFPSWNLDP